MAVPGGFGGDGDGDGDEGDGEGDEAEEDDGARRSSKRMRITQGWDVHRGQRVSIVPPVPADEERKQKEHDAARRELSAVKARRRSRAPPAKGKARGTARRGAARGSTSGSGRTGVRSGQANTSLQSTKTDLRTILEGIVRGPSAHNELPLCRLRADFELCLRRARRGRRLGGGQRTREL
ncbi:hypothetical protein K466DRAFT_656877 [Polyporus arcularius HHB13444]|uniref:Uncharacterized protein n=1 Tax=Polyporus arcularius HHB13444 TaxID=1314778 RepID=A0A5C3NU72_9APHY|nr:hypothetical protein K466DRAFT_656877 [Polyporus arcularius HHB13444]